MLSYIYSYYENPNMYLRQVEEWNRYPSRVKEHLTICITDDCSSRHPLREIPEAPDGIQIRRFQLMEKVPWNASTSGSLRMEGRDPGAIKRKLDQKRREKRENDIRTLPFPNKEIE